MHLKGSAGALRELLTRHAWQKEGIYQGREVARQALARKTEECVKLEERVRVLEEENRGAEMAREVMRLEMMGLADELSMWIRPVLIWLGF